MNTNLFALQIIASVSAGMMLGFFAVRYAMDNYYEANCKIVEDSEQDGDSAAENLDLLMFAASIKFFGLAISAATAFVLLTMYDFMVVAGPLFFFIFPPVVNFIVSGLLFLVARLSNSFFELLVRTGKSVDFLP